MKAPIVFLATVLFATASTLAAEISPESLVGKPLPALTGLDYFKARPALGGKPAIVEFWATWCPPCRKSIPHLNEIYKKYGSKGLQVLGITDEPNQTIRAFVKNIPIDYPVATARNTVLEKFGISSVPRAFLVDKTGKVVWQGHPMELEEAEIEKLL